MIAAAGVGLLACGAAVGAYFIDPSLFGENAQPVKTAAPVANIQPSPDSTAEILAGSADAKAGSSDGNAKAMQPGELPESKIGETFKSQKPNLKQAQTSVGDNSSGGDPDDETVYVGNMKIHHGAIETPDVYIDENGIRRRIPQPVVPPINISPEQLQMMSPAQRRKLRMLIEQQRNNQRRRMRNLPAPVPSPENP